MCGGFPCQPFSIAGKRLGLNDERSGVLPKLIEIIKIISTSQGEQTFSENFE